MARESQFWRDVVSKALAPYGKLARVENVLELGFPDVFYTLHGVSGLLELKDIDGWPARADTVVEVRHYTEEQRAWHRRWRDAGTLVFVAVRVAGHGATFSDDLALTARRVSDEFFVFDARMAADVVGRSPRAAWYHAAAYAGKAFDGLAVSRLLTSPW